MDTNMNHFTDEKIMKQAQGNTANKLHNFCSVFQKSLLPVTHAILLRVFQRNRTVRDPVKLVESLNVGLKTHEPGALMSVGGRRGWTSRFREPICPSPAFWISPVFPRRGWCLFIRWKWSVLSLIKCWISSRNILMNTHTFQNSYLDIL